MSTRQLTKNKYKKPIPIVDFVLNLFSFDVILKIYFIVILCFYSIFVQFPALKDINTVSFSFAIIVFYFFTFNIGYLTFNYLFKNSKYLAAQNLAIWIYASVYWLLGIIILNIPAYITHVFKANFSYSVIVLYLFLYLIYFVFASNKTLSLKTCKEYITKNKFEFAAAFIGVVLTLTFYLFWGARTNFISFNTDNLQNVNLANKLKDAKIFNLFAIYLSPQYTQVDYVTVLTPLIAVITDIIPFQKVLYFMYWMEIVTVSVVFITRYYLFRALNIPIISSLLISIISVFVTFAGLYMPGTIYNQQIQVFILPAMVYLLWNKKNILALILLCALIPFHFTMSIFLIWTIGTLWFFRSIYNKFNLRFMYLVIRLIKLISVVGLSILLFLESVYTFETNYFITAVFIELLSTKPQFLNSVGIYSNLGVLQIMMNGMGPVLVALLIVIPVAWIVSHKIIERWVFLVISTQLMILTIPFPVASRTFVFFSIPFSIATYLVFKRIVFGKELLTQILLIISIVSLLVWSVTVRNNDIDITGRYWNNSFLNADYQDSLVKSSQLLNEKNIKHSDYKIVSEYFVKQHFEVFAKKIDDNGVYEENKIERGLMYDFLSGEKDFACEYYNKDYLVYFINERVYKWIKTPRSLATLSSFSVWWSEPTPLIEKDYIQNYKPVTIGTIYQDVTFQGYNRLIIIKCK